MVLYRWNGTLLRKPEGLATSIRCCCNDCICVCYEAGFVLVTPTESDIDSLINAIKTQSWFKKWEWIGIGTCRIFDPYDLSRAIVYVLFKCCLDQYEISQITSEDDDPCLVEGLVIDIDDFATSNTDGVEQIGSTSCDLQAWAEAAEERCGDNPVPSIGEFEVDDTRYVDCYYPAVYQ